MAELVLKINAGSSYEDGDVLCAFNRRRIRCAHADRLTRPRDAGLTRDGLRPANSLAAKALELTRQYKFERLSRYVCRRTNLRTGEVEEFSDKTEQYIDLPAFLARRLKHPRHAIFGLVGRESWYGGNTYTTHADLDNVWQEIEARTKHREIDYDLWPAGQQDLKSHLFLAVDDFDDAEAAEMVAPEMDETDPEYPVMVAKRQRQVDWTNLSGMGAARISEIRDRSRVVDLRRDRTHARGEIVQIKRAAARAPGRAR